MATRKKKKKGGEVTDRLNDIYQKAQEEGIWLREWAPEEGGMYMAAAGSIKPLEEIEKQTGKEIDISKLKLGDIVNISVPGTGKTREEACEEAIKAFKEYREGKDDAMILYGSFKERGYKIDAYLSNKTDEWIVRAYKGSKLVKEIQIPMSYKPVFVPDIEDVANLEEKTEELLKKLP